MKVHIPFREQFKTLMLAEQKTCTSRTKRYGNMGDTFDAFGFTFELTNVFRASLGSVAQLLFYEEGFLDPKAFVICWKEIHPRKGYNPNQEVYIHSFKLLSGNI